LLGATTLVYHVQAQSPINITTTAVPFLHLSPDARAGGMGDLGLATAADANSVFYNRAKLPFADKHTGIGLSYTPWMRDVTNDMYLLTGSVFHQLDENQVISAGIRYFNIGEVPMSDYSGNKLPSVQPREFAIDFGYSRKLSNTLGIAAAIRYINSKLASGNVNGINYQAGSAVAGDISLYYNGVDSASGGWSAGLAISNLGSKIGYTNEASQKEFLPANVGMGLAYTGILDQDNQLTVGIDLNHLLVPQTPTETSGLKDYYSKGVMESWISSFNNQQYMISLGAEYVYMRQFSLRAGYLVVPKATGDNGGFTAGLGLRLNVFDVNFSYLAASGSGVTRNPLSNTVRLGLNFNLGK
jgi:hypothetical protein